MSERMRDLSIEVMEDGSIDIEQGLLEPAVINLHPTQVRWIAQRAGILEAVTPPAAILPSVILDRLRHVQAKLHGLADPCWSDEIAERVGNGLAYREAIDGARTSLEWILEDIEAQMASTPCPSDKNPSAAIVASLGGISSVRVLAGSDPEITGREQA